MSLRIGLAALALAGCIVGPDYERPTVPLPDAFTGADATTALADSVPPQWWRLFGDATLDELVAIARANNIDIRQAVARIEEADANLRAVHAALFPEIDLGGTANRTAFSSAVASPPSAGTPSVRNDLRLALSTSFEVDFWGKLRRATEAARAQDLSTRYAKEVVTLSIAALTTQTYFSLRSLDAQIASTRATLATREDTLSIVRRRAEAGLASDLDVRQAEVARFDAALQLDELTRQREIAEHLLATLTGKLDLALVPGDVTQLPRPAAPPPGLPSTLLERRPDIRQAEQDLIAANAQIGVAKAQLFPTITLTGNFGGESAALAGLFTLPGRIWALGADLRRRQAQRAGRCAAGTPAAIARELPEGDPDFVPRGRRRVDQRTPIRRDRTRRASQRRRGARGAAARHHPLRGGLHAISGRARFAAQPQHLGARADPQPPESAVRERRPDEGTGRRLAARGTHRGALGACRACSHVCVAGQCLH